MTKGWQNESERHKLSRNGVKSSCKRVPTGIKYKEENRLGIIAIYDNSGKTMDRYTVVFDTYSNEKHTQYDCLGMSNNPDDPQGFSQMFDCILGKHLGKRIKFSDLPQNIQMHVEYRVNNSL
jgi:hypothetical protein